MILNMTPEERTWKIRRDQEVHQEGIDPPEMREDTKDSIGGTKAQIDGSKLQKEEVGEILALIEGERRAEEIILLMEGEDTKRTISEGVARDP